MSKKNPEIDAYIKDAEQWQPELKQLRKIVLNCGLTEELKWRAPCYTLDGKNVAMIAGFKEYCVLSFFKGALLKDPAGILQKPGENTQAARVIRFTGLAEIKEQESTLKAYVEQAMEVEQAGLTVKKESNKKLDLPAELLDRFEQSPDFQAAFEALTPGRQRGYVMYFASAKQSQTRVNRIEKYRQQILDGKGMNDCTCGLSKKLPTCDGSHKAIR